MDDVTGRRSDWLAERFESNRGHLVAVAHRMLGSSGDAEDAVQEAWLRVSRSGAAEVENFRGWLTTIVARICLDVLRSRKARPEAALADAPAGQGIADPEQQVLLADSVGLALLVVLETLPPAERVAFVLHDLFEVPFDEIAPVVGRTPVAARQLASRARRRLRGAPTPRASDHDRKRAVVKAFLAASRNGDMEALLRLLDPDVVMRADAAVAAMGPPAEQRGREAVAAFFHGRARAARTLLADGEPALAWARGGTVRVLFEFAIRDGIITAIDLVGDRERIEARRLVFDPA